MRTAVPFVFCIFWTAVLFILYRLPAGVMGADWRLPIVIIISWVLGIVLVFLLSFGRKIEPPVRILSTVDENTGLANRRAFQGLVEPLLKAAVSFSEKGLIAILNINDLDRVMEEEGDERAEKIVSHVARAFLESLRASDILARYDTDELVAFLPKASMVFSERVTERIMMNVAAERRQMENPRDIHVSVGYAEFDPVAPRSLDHLIRQAYDDMIRNMGERKTATEPED